jgi:uncharacterized protein YmfQ (DUF2313 family)
MIAFSNQDLPQGAGTTPTPEADEMPGTGTLLRVVDEVEAMGEAVIHRLARGETDAGLNLLPRWEGLFARFGELVGAQEAVRRAHPSDAPERETVGEIDIDTLIVLAARLGRLEAKLYERTNACRAGRRDEQSLLHVDDPTDHPQPQRRPDRSADTDSRESPLC